MPATRRRSQVTFNLQSTSRSPTPCSSHREKSIDRIGRHAAAVARRHDIPARAARACGDRVAGAAGRPERQALSGGRAAPCGARHRAADASPDRGAPQTIELGVLSAPSVAYVIPLANRSALQALSAGAIELETRTPDGIMWSTLATHVRTDSSVDAGRHGRVARVTNADCAQRSNRTYAASAGIRVPTRSRSHRQRIHLTSALCWSREPRCGQVIVERCAPADRTPTCPHDCHRERPTVREAITSAVGR